MCYDSTHTNLFPKPSFQMSGNTVARKPEILVCFGLCLVYQTTSIGVGKSSDFRDWRDDAVPLALVNQCLSRSFLIVWGGRAA